MNPNSSHWAGAGNGVAPAILQTGREGRGVPRPAGSGTAAHGPVIFASAGRGFVPNPGRNAISEIDPLSRQEVRRIEVGHGPHGLSPVPGDRYLLVSNAWSGTVSVVDLELNESVAEISVGPDPRHMAVSADGHRAFICVRGAGRVAMLDLSAVAKAGRLGLLKSYDLGRTARPCSVAVDPTGSLLFVAEPHTTHLYVINLEVDHVSVIELGALGGHDVAFTVDSKYALVTMETVPEVLVIDLETLSVATRIPVGQHVRSANRSRCCAQR